MYPECALKCLHYPKTIKKNGDNWSLKSNDHIPVSIVGNDRSPSASGNFEWRVRSTLYSPVWRVTVVRRVGT